VHYRFLFIILLFAQVSCDRIQSEASFLSKLKERGFIVFGTENTLSTYYSDKDNQWVGFEYELARAFAADHGLELKVKVLTNSQEGFQLLEEDQVDFIGANLLISQDKEQKFRYSQAFYKVRQEVVCNRFGRKIKDRTEISKVNFVVSKGSSYDTYLQTLAKVLKGLQWKTYEASTEELLSQVNEMRIDCTVADSHVLALQQRIMPNLVVVFPLSTDQGIHWFVNKEDYQLERIMNRWFDQKTILVHETVEKYFGFITKDFDYYDTKFFEDRMQTRLKKWKGFFLQAGKITKIDWKLLAAISYQESHWEEDAVSPTGVRGLMMLTHATAARMKIDNRRDPEQSITAGAKYFLWLKKRFKAEFADPDLTWIALAAYNVGHGHIDDLIALAKQRKQPYNKWAHIKELLPLLSRPEVYSHLKYGYANGSEPLLYVDRVRNFYRILSHKKKI
jgi:membrane-bound lytic murein transglycosylase F